MTGQHKDLTEYQVVTANLKTALKERRMTYRDLAEGIGLSESGVKKIFLAEDGSFQRLAQICRHLGLSMTELMEDNRSVAVAFSANQQQEFQKERTLFFLFWLLVYERRILSDAQEALKLNKADTFRLLRKLDRLELIKLLPGDRVRLPSIKAVRWTGEGEFIRKLYQDWTRAFVDGLSKPNSPPGEFFLFRYLQMTPQTYEEFKAALIHLEEEFIRRSIHEMRTRASEVEHVRWLVGVDNRSFVTGDSFRAKT